jgi:hypothetical protein
VSALPSIVLVCYTYLLVAGDAWSGHPNWQRAVDSFVHLGIGGTLALLGLSIAVALALHPLQFALVQLLEGYWGVSPLAERARGARMRHHWERVLQLRLRQSRSRVALRKRGPTDEDDDLRTRMRLVSQIAEAGRILQTQPAEPDQVMPTRLGIVLRYYESAAGEPYGLRAIQVMPYLARVARPEDMAYVNDQRSQLDLAVRMSVTALFTSLLTTIVLWRGGLWLLVALLPFSVGYLAYRGAVVAAGQYGRAVAVVIALNRFALYERLHLPLPDSANAERVAARSLTELMDYNDEFRVVYRHPASPPS